MPERAAGVARPGSRMGPVGVKRVKIIRLMRGYA